ncbi:MAG: hypothetical protein KZQ93_07795 [Candidatus Thiodiazotropha sp. (ex Monitilora ramsayi)]|nr:hypothetical protein [Candidatus Thiodiazotropha sp. (ex Monitilora ramsayi)]
MTHLPLISRILKFAEKLRFRQLFLVTLGLFVFDLLIPDMIPFIDELLLGLLALLLGVWRKKQPDKPQLETETRDRHNEKTQ